MGNHSKNVTAIFDMGQYGREGEKLAIEILPLL